MKRLLIIAVLCLSALTAKAQTIEVVLGEQPRIFLEKTRVMDNSTTFAYLEAGYKGGAMVKLFHEQKFWDAPAYIHAEYQSSFNDSHTAPPLQASSAPQAAYPARSTQESSWFGEAARRATFMRDISTATSSGLIQTLTSWPTHFAAI